MTISAEQVAHVANLARLNIDESDQAAYSDKLSETLKLIDQMQQIDTDNVEPLANPHLDTALRTREDKNIEPDQRELFQSTAPNLANGRKAIEAGLYLVPKVIE